jgi:hypothetical protein
MPHSPGPETVERVRLIALSDANEDWTGLYELIWSLNRIYPDLEESEKVKMAVHALTSLIEAGLIELGLALWKTQAIRTVPPEEYSRAISNQDAWKSPDDVNGDTYYCFATTEAGEQAYASLTPREIEILT